MVVKSVFNLTFKQIFSDKKRLNIIFILVIASLAYSSAALPSDDEKQASSGKFFGRQSHKVHFYGATPSSTGITSADTLNSGSSKKNSKKTGLRRLFRFKKKHSSINQGMGTMNFNSLPANSQEAILQNSLETASKPHIEYDTERTKTDLNEGSGYRIQQLGNSPITDIRAENFSLKTVVSVDNYSRKKSTLRRVKSLPARSSFTPSPLPQALATRSETTCIATGEPSSSCIEQPTISGLSAPQMPSFRQEMLRKIHIQHVNKGSFLLLTQLANQHIAPYLTPSDSTAERNGDFLFEVYTCLIKSKHKDLFDQISQTTFHSELANWIDCPFHQINWQILDTFLKSHGYDNYQQFISNIENNKTSIDIQLLHTFIFEIISELSQYRATILVKNKANRYISFYKVNAIALKNYLAWLLISVLTAQDYVLNIRQNANAQWMILILLSCITMEDA